VQNGRWSSSRFATPTASRRPRSWSAIGGADALINARVEVPSEAPASATAIDLAFARLRDRASRHPLAAAHQVRDLVLALFAEQAAPGDLARRSLLVGDVVSVARRLGLGEAEIQDLMVAAELHDVGMLCPRLQILQNAGPLGPDGWATLRRHPVIGERMLAAVPALRQVAPIVRSGYERFDGSGYPDGLSGEQIPRSARIIAVCVAFHAIQTTRPPRPAVSAAAAAQELRRCAGSQFDPRVVAAFLDLLVLDAGPSASRGPAAAVD
jgi:response regulator RpfG family c-di-GMP phosphodiesterase